MRKSGIKHRSSRKWTVIVVRRFGKISSHEISGFWVKAAGLLLILILAGSGYLFYQNQVLTVERQNLLARLVLPPAESEPEKAAPERTKPATTTTAREQEPEARTTVSSTTTTEVQATTTLAEAAPTTLEATTTTLPTAEAEAEPTTTTLPEGETPAIQPALVQVTDVVITLLGGGTSGIKISHKLNNKRGDGKKITGYTFVLFKNNELEEPLVGHFPRSAVFEEERPTDFKKGVAFSIGNYKTLRTRYYTDKAIKDVVILVYDQEGNLIVTQTYPVPSA